MSTPEAVPVTVAVAARDEARVLPALLSSLKEQTHPPAEIVIADGGSADDTVRVAQSCAGVRVLEIGPAFPGRGRNAALASAGQSWVALIDAGCVADRGWLKALVQGRGSDERAVVYGNYAPELRSEWDIAQALTTLAPIDPATGVRGPSTASMLIHREAWARVGGFPEDLRAAEDLVFFERLRAAGVAHAWAPGAVVRWEMAAGPRSFFRRLRLYSAHHSLAGLSHTWHRRVVVMDLLALALLVVGGWSPVAWLLAAAFGMARVASTVGKRRGNIGARTAFRPDRLARVALLLLLADVATWMGLFDRAAGRVARAYVDSAYVTYWSLQDPLCQSQSLPVVRALAAAGWKMALLTFEQPPWRLPDAERRATQAALQAEGVTWLPLDYHKRPRLLATTYDVGRGALRLRGLAAGRGARLLHSRGSIPAAMALAAVRTTPVRFFYDADGPLSQEYVDAGLWSPASPGFRLARSVEEASLRRADQVAVLSTLRQEEVEIHARGPVAVLPCGIDTARFQRDDARRAELRAELGLQGTVLVYAGKSGGWYLTEPLIDFARAAQDVLGTVTLLVLTGDAPEAFLEGARRRGVPCVVRRAGPAEMPGYLSAADAGLSFRSASPSQRAASPIKNGEYLACGLPVVSTSVAGDYPALLRGENVGVVVENLDAPGLLGAAQALRALLADPSLMARCRSAALRHIDLHAVVIPRYLEIYRELLGEA